MAHIRSESTKRVEWALVAALAGLAVAARFAGLREQTPDLKIFVSWYHELVAHGLGHEIGNYNAPFLYVFAITLVLPGPAFLKIKLVWLLFDLVLAFFAYKITKRMTVTLVVILLPTVVINASFYGQMDAMWASLALGAVYFFLRDRPWWGVAFCTLALAIKPQGIFIFPLVILLALTGRIPWRPLLLAPVLFVALDVPAVLLGRDPIELIGVYGLDRQARHVPSLTLRAPSLYAFVPSTGEHVDIIRTVGTILAAAVVKRYFFLADVLTVLLVVPRPRLWYVPLLVQISSLLCYQPYVLGGRTPQMLPPAIPAPLRVLISRPVSPPAGRPAPLPARPA